MSSPTEDLRTDLWRRVFAGTPAPDEDPEYASRLFESDVIRGEGSVDSVSEIVRQIVAKTGETVEEDDVSDYLDQEKLTPLFYEALIAYVENLDASTGANSDEELDDADEEETTDSFSPVNADAKMVTVDHLFNLIETDQLDLTPPWQRTIVWSPARQRKLIESILLGIPIPSIILHHINAGQLGKERYAIIDGKQRLTSIHRFLRNEFRLPPFPVGPTHPLYPCRGKWYSNPEKPASRSLEAPYRSRITGTQLPVLLFRDVAEGRLRQIFKLYNVTSTRLNAAEVRNAVYQDNPLHQMLFVLSGEGGDHQLLPYIPKDEQLEFRSRLQNVLPSLKRYAALDFLSRYLGYSRAVVGTKPYFRPTSTSTAIDRYFDQIETEAESPEDVAREIIEVFNGASHYFNLKKDGKDWHLAFYPHADKPKRPFEALQAITSMVCTRLLLRVDALGAADQTQIESAVRQSILAVEYPDKQQRSTIWDFQASRFLELASSMNLNLKEFDGGAFLEFGERMRQARLPAEATSGEA